MHDFVEGACSLCVCIKCFIAIIDAIRRLLYTFVLVGARVPAKASTARNMGLPAAATPHAATVSSLSDSVKRHCAGITSSSIDSETNGLVSRVRGQRAGLSMRNVARVRRRGQGAIGDTCRELIGQTAWLTLHEPAQALALPVSAF